MDDKTAELIKQLADKLGTTAEHLWGVLIKQAPISTTINFVFCVGFSLLLIWWVRFMHKKITVKKEGEYRAEWDMDDAIFPIIFTIFAAGILAPLLVISVKGFVTAWVNPEYWALRYFVE